MKSLHRAAELIAAALFAAMFAAFLVQVFARYVLNHPVAWSSEACSLAYIWIVCWSAATLVSERQHIGFDLLYKAQPPARRRLLAIFITASILLVFVAGLPGSYDYVSFLRRKTMFLHVPMALAYSCFLIFLVIVVATSLVRLRRLFGRGWQEHL